MGNPALPVISGLVVCSLLMVAAGAWAFRNRPPAKHSVRWWADTGLIVVGWALILAALWAALLGPWPKR
jgi:hypothetical protein